jgi:valyl-tRNA synthetase
MSVFNGVLEPDNEEINYYYPTNDLVTGPDILFFWVARMVVAGYEFRGEKPFSNVYFTGLVRDAQRRKMSKSLGNSPDALKLIEDYGADGVRVGLLLSSAAGNDLMFDEALCQQGKNFANKIWNGFRLIQSWEVADIPQPEAAKKAIEWYTALFNKTVLEIEDDFSKYRISDALMATYKLLWEHYSSWLLELIKPHYQQPVDRTTKAQVIALMENNLRILHPFMPFLSEDIWQQISERSPEEALIVNHWPKVSPLDQADLLAGFEWAKQVISEVRTVRKEKQIAQKEVLDMFVMHSSNPLSYWTAGIEKLANLTPVQLSDAPIEGALSFRVDAYEYFIPITGAIDVEAEIAKVTEELNYTKGFLSAVEKKLSNERFVSNAPETVLALEKKKQSDAMAKIETLAQSLLYLKG